MLQPDGRLFRYCIIDILLNELIWRHWSGPGMIGSDIDGDSPFYKVSSGIRLLCVFAFEFLLLDIS